MLGFADIQEIQILWNQAWLSQDNSLSSSQSLDMSIELVDLCSSKSYADGLGSSSANSMAAFTTITSGYLQKAPFCWATFKSLTSSLNQFLSTPIAFLISLRSLQVLQQSTLKLTLSSISFSFCKICQLVNRLLQLQTNTEVLSSLVSCILELMQTQVAAASCRYLTCSLVLARYRSSVLTAVNQVRSDSSSCQQRTLSHFTTLVRILGVMCLFSRKSSVRGDWHESRRDRRRSVLPSYRMRWERRWKFYKEEIQLSEKSDVSGEVLVLLDGVLACIVKSIISVEMLEGFYMGAEWQLIGDRVGCGYGMSSLDRTELKGNLIGHLSTLFIINCFFFEGLLLWLVEKTVAGFIFLPFIGVYPLPQPITLTHPLNSFFYVIFPHFPHNMTYAPLLLQISLRSNGPTKNQIGVNLIGLLLSILPPVIRQNLIPLTIQTSVLPATLHQPHRPIAHILALHLLQTQQEVLGIRKRHETVATGLAGALISDDFGFLEGRVLAEGC